MRQCRPEILRTWQAAKRATPAHRPSWRCVRPGDQRQHTALDHGLSRRRFAYIGDHDTVRLHIPLRTYSACWLTSSTTTAQTGVSTPSPAADHDPGHRRCINSAWGGTSDRGQFPYRLALAGAAPFALIDRRDTFAPPEGGSRLHFDTNIGSDRLAVSGFTAEYSLFDALSPTGDGMLAVCPGRGYLPLHARLGAMRNAVYVTAARPATAIYIAPPGGTPVSPRSRWASCTG